MDSRTLELYRCLQSGPYDESGFKQIQRLLSGQCRVLRSRNDLATLAEIVQLLEGWANAATSGRLRAAALGEAAEIAERELRQLSLANDLRARAAQRNSMTAARTVQVDAGGESTLDEAISAWEDMLEADPTEATVQHLAELYVKRDRAGDRNQAADLYCMLGELMGNPAGIGMVQTALSLEPEHEDAQALLDRYTAEIRAAVPTVTLNVPAPVEGASRTRHATLSGMVTPAPQALPTADAPGAMNAALAAPPALGVAAPPPLRAAVQSFPAIGSVAYQAPAPPPLGAAVQAAAPPPLSASSTNRKAVPTPRAPVMVLQLPSNNQSGPPLRVLPASSLSPVVIDEGAEPDANPRPDRTRLIALGGGALAAVAAAAVVFLILRAQAPTAPAATHAANTAPSEPVKPALAPPPVQPEAAPVPPPAPEPKPEVAAAEKPAAPPVAGAQPAQPSKALEVQAQLDQVILRGGKLNEQLLAATLEKLNAKLVTCYGQALAQKPKLKGRIILSWTVKPNGRTASAKAVAGTTIKDQPLIDCSTQVIDVTRFPKPKKQAAKVRLPFQYRQT